MKLLTSFLALFSLSALAAPLTVTIEIEGISLSKFEAPISHFVSTNPLCTQVILLPLPGTGPKQASVQGKMKIIDTRKVELEIPTEYQGHFCMYRFDYAHFGPYKRLEALNLASTKGASSRENELDLLSHPGPTFGLECGHQMCRVLKNGSQVGYANSNIGYIYLDHRKLNTNPGPKAYLKLLFK